MSKIKSCAYRRVVLTCPVNNGSVAHSIKIGKSKIGITKENNKKWALNAKIGHKFMNKLTSTHTHTHTHTSKTDLCYP